MERVRLGRTGLMVTRTAFGVLPLQRTPLPEAVRILRRALDAGINFYDTARAYTDSEEKLGAAFDGLRDRVVIATKSGATTRAALLRDLETSLHNLRTDHVDVLQLHNPATVPDPTDAESALAGARQAQREGKTRFIGFTNHSLERACVAADSGAYDTLQFPLTTLADPRDLELIGRCQRLDLGLIAMKPLSGGLLTNVRAVFAFFRQYPNVVPIWGIQRMSELEEFVALEAAPPVLDQTLRARIEQDRRELSKAFCRACGYCLPCPAEIPIPMVARMPLLLRRMPYQQFMTAEWREKINRVRACINCGACRKRCPYQLDTPALLRAALADYESFCPPATTHAVEQDKT